MNKEEESLLQQLKEMESLRAEAVDKHAQAKKAVMDAETRLIEITLRRDRVKEQLRMWRYANVDDMETVDREEDIERFRKVLPELMEKIK